MAQSRILVVEDERIIAKDIQNTLEKLGYQVVEVAGTGEEAVRMAGEKKPDLILMDIVLKNGMDGIEAAEKILQDCNIPVVYLTAYVDETTLRRATLTEPFGYITKPFQENELRTTIEVALYKHKRETRLRESEKLLGTVLESISEAILTTDLQGKVTYLNPVAESLTGFLSREAVGLPLIEVLRSKSPKERKDPLSSVIRAVEEGGCASADGVTLLSKLETPLAINISAAPIRDDQGRLTGSVLTFYDVTERKRAEDKLRQAMVELVCSRAEMEEFSYIVARDLREPLRMVEVYASLLEKHYGETMEPEIRKSLSIILGETAHIQGMLDDLLAYSLVTSQGGEFKPADFNELLDRALKKLQDEIVRRGAEITRGILPVLLCDSLQIVQLFENLVDNALKFTEGKPRIHVSAEEKEHEWVLAVRDNGVGIGPEYREFIFLIFQRLHGRKYPGSGIGLTLCRKIAERHGGRIWVESEPGKGSAFYFSLPKIQKK